MLNAGEEKKGLYKWVTRMHRDTSNVMNVKEKFRERLEATGNARALLTS